jgi:mannosyltransferase OCH1-like enzyme
MSIPKIAFTFWEGSQFTYMHALTIVTFQKYNPDFKIIIYISYKKDNTLVMWSTNEQKKQYNNIYDINLLKNIPNIEFIEVDLCKLLNYDGILSSVWKSDIIRLMKLYEHGGMYIDFDILFIKKVPESLFVMDKIMFNTYHKVINNAIIISNKNNHILKILIDEIMKIINDGNIKDIYMQFGPTLITKVIKGNKELENDVYYIPNDMTCPYLWNEMDKLFLTNIDKITKNTFCIHWYNGAIISRNYCSNFDITKINKNNCIFEKLLSELLSQ